MLTAATVGAYLEEKGLLAPGASAEVAELGGGVSNIVLGVEADGLSCVVKQSFPRLRVADEWLAKRERAVTEACALELAAALMPEAVPRVLELDREACAFTIERAPRDWQTWKDDLLEGRADQTVAHRVGLLLAAWHGGTTDVATARHSPTARDSTSYGSIPTTTIMRAHPDLAGAVGAYADRLLGPGRCLVHGDYSPKNVLVGPERLWLIDFEVTHFGEPSFDLAFMLNHLFLKALHRPGTTAGYLACARAFWTAYADAVPDPLAPDTTAVFGQVGCLMIARVDGKSPAEYLSVEERTRARSLGRQLLTDPPDDTADLFEAVETAAAG
jgi:5-methylthioribose kinase